ncbi:hypothetical protein PCANB_001750 [Pneumocystis canis]|nr:hypothetical protein PCANB_001750 [Pneumocystis canis]
MKKGVKRIHSLSEDVRSSVSSCQVIVDLSIVAKELLENALDAQSTVIEICFKNYGMDSIEVSDNGKGILIQDLECLAKQHSTSKIREFEDLDSLSSYGFRGETLHSLCTLSHLQITTTTEELVPQATRITYDHQANIISKEIVSSHKGTIVRAEQLFYSLPVRRKEFERNHKHDFQRALSLLQSYAIISTGIKLQVTHQLPNKYNNIYIFPMLIIRQKIIHFSTHGNAYIKENITTLFGIRLFSTLMQIDYNIMVTINISGFISKPAYGMKSLNNIKQYIYINSRPCLLQQVTKTIREVYRILVFFTFFLIYLDRYDVNVSVDKRTIFLHHEKEIVSSLKSNLITSFQNALEEIDQNAIFLSQITDCKTSNISPNKNLEKMGVNPTNNILKCSKIMSDKNSHQISEKPNVQEESLNDILDSCGHLSVDESKDNILSLEKDTTKSLYVEKLISDNVTQFHEKSDIQNISVCVEREKQTPVYQRASNINSILSDSNNEFSSPIRENLNDNHNKQEDKGKNKSLHDYFQKAQDKIDNTTTISQTNDSIVYKISESDVLKTKKRSQDSIKNKEKKDSYLNVKWLYKYEYQTLSTRITTSKKQIEENFSKHLLNRSSYSKIESLDVSNISREQSENQLSLTLSKKDFFSMKIIGQFNLGFIIVSLPSNEKDYDSNLFIIDQHASDEKYNFEKLQMKTIIESQPLVKPCKLNLTVIDEITVIEHLDLLKKKGFKIELDHSKKPGEKCKLLSLPQKSGIIFGTEDLEDMISKLQENPQKDIQCTKIKNILASKACHSSVMIGDSLSENTMKNIVQHMGEMDNPWNCPHGRPTIRMIGKISKI